jgi:CheY-like chemotaxis protein
MALAVGFGMEMRRKILVLDDDSEWLNTCRELLAQLPSKPEIFTASSGTDALSLLQAQPFRLLVCDLRMPQVDGLQVLTIVRRQFPELRTVALTGFADEEFRSRAYALGVDLFWLKTDLVQNPRLFLDCVEALLVREDGDVRGAPKQNLLDAIRMESALHNSSVLRVTSGTQVAQIWIRDGQLIDARVEDTDGEVAFQRILKWKACTVENLPAEAGHVQTITKSLDALVLESAQAVEKAAYPTPEQREEEVAFVTRLSAVAYEGAEFVVKAPVKKEDTAKGWGIQDMDAVAAWSREAAKTAQRLGQKLNTGPWTHIAGNNLQRHLVLLPASGATFVVGWPPSADPRRLFEQSKKLADMWVP